jgi:hypothetical protein
MQIVIGTVVVDRTGAAIWVNESKESIKLSVPGGVNRLFDFFDPGVGGKFAIMCEGTVGGEMVTSEQEETLVVECLELRRGVWCELACISTEVIQQHSFVEEGEKVVIRGTLRLSESRLSITSDGQCYELNAEGLYSDCLDELPADNQPHWPEFRFYSEVAGLLEPGQTSSIVVKAVGLLSGQTWFRKGETQLLPTDPFKC